MNLSHDVARYFTVVVLAAAIALAPRQTSAAVYFVDGACASSGTGTALACGASGPFKTINEGLSAVRAGDTLNIRGPHAGFDGVYNEYLGVWGTTGDAYPGAALSCTSGAPCVVQGCPASACGSDERPIVRGMVRRTDWTDEGSGVYSRVMEADSNASYPGNELPRDNYDPEMVMQGTSSPLTVLQYAGDSAAVATLAGKDGYWAYHPASHRIYVNPAGSANPNSSATVLVPNKRTLMNVVHGEGGTHCPSSSCPTNGYVTFRRLAFEGSRWQGVALAGLPGNELQGVVFENVAIRYVPRFLMNPYRTNNLQVSNSTLEYGCRGISYVPSGAGGCFGYRTSHMRNGTVTNLTIRHLGTAAAGKLQCDWCDAPWNNMAGNTVAANGVGFDLKQSQNVVVTGLNVSDVSYEALQVDVSHDCTIENFDIQRARYGAIIREYTPDTSTGLVRNYNITLRNGRFDNVGFNDGGAILGCRLSPLGAGEFGYHLYNLFISRVSYAGIAIGAGYCQGDGGDRIAIWNNSISGVSPLVGANNPPDGIKIGGAVTNLDIRNNVISGMTSQAVELSIAAVGTNPTLDYNLYNANSGGLLSWSGTVSTTLAGVRSLTGKETHGISADPRFVDAAAAPPNLHLQSGSPAIDVGVSLSSFFNVDYDGAPRPSGAGWDMGADELGGGAAPTPVPSSAPTPVGPPSPPVLLEVIPQ